LLFILFSYGITSILLSGYLTAAQTVNNAIRHIRRAIERKCVQTRKIINALTEPQSLTRAKVTRTLTKKPDTGKLYHIRRKKGMENDAHCQKNKEKAESMEKPC
jgi:hypothetical protein